MVIFKWILKNTAKTLLHSDLCKTQPFKIQIKWNNVILFHSTFRSHFLTFSLQEKRRKRRKERPRAIKRSLSNQEHASPCWICPSTWDMRRSINFPRKKVLWITLWVCTVFQVILVREHSLPFKKTQNN